MPRALTFVACYAFDPEQSAGCQEPCFAAPQVANTRTRRGSFDDEYPPVYYRVMSLAPGSVIEASALAGRLFNVALFVVLSTIVFVLLWATRRPNLLWGWLLTAVPLGLVLIASNNPSGWAAAGVGTAWISLLGYYESEGRRRSFYFASILPLLGAIVALVFFLQSRQAGVGACGFSGGQTRPWGEFSPSALISYNLLEVPFLWVGVFGAWNLGWLDTGPPGLDLEPPVRPLGRRLRLPNRRRRHGRPHRPPR